VTKPLTGDGATPAAHVRPARGASTPTGAEAPPSTDSFARWFEAQHGKRPSTLPNRVLAEVERDATRVAKKARDEYEAVLNWEFKRNISLLAWQAGARPSDEFADRPTDAEKDAANQERAVQAEEAAARAYNQGRQDGYDEGYAEGERNADHR